MKIRSHLIILILATLLPVVLFAAVMTERLWEEQRASYEQTFLERVRGLRVALDTELAATQRSLRALSDTGGDGTDDPERFRARLLRKLQAEPAWAGVAIVASRGEPWLEVHREGEPAMPRVDAATVAAVFKTREPAISDLIAASEDARYYTFVAVPMARNGAIDRVMYVGIEHRAWLDFLQSYPIAENATLTLNDRNGAIIARTLNDERWVGKPSSPAFLERARDKAEDAFRNVGLEGQHFYSAFSRSKTSGWTLGTGVPQQHVEGALRGSTNLIVIGVLGTIGIAWLLALLVGRRITGSIRWLAASARTLPDSLESATDKRLPIEEVETVRRTLEEAGVLLRKREQSLNEAVARETQARAAAEHANRAKDQFLAMLGHELRNPLSAMSSVAAVLERAGTQSDVAAQARAALQRQLRSLTEIVNELLDVARLTSGKIALNRRTVDLSDVARHAVEVFRNTGRLAHLTLETGLTPAWVYGDETRLEQVVTNLLENACKYAHPGGRVSITTSTADDWAILEVRDDGVGISPELLPHVFEVFAQDERTLDRAQGGLGLGLTVVQRLTAMHGGNVTASSEGRDRGARFVVRLPRVAPPAEATAAGKPQPSVAARRIVLVEDNDDNREALRNLLMLSGHEVHLAVDGPDAVSAIAAVRPDVALVDIGLPGFDGLEVARRIRASADGIGKTCLIALSGYGRPEDRAAALAAGFDEYLIKPFDLDAFDALLSGHRAG